MLSKLDKAAYRSLVFVREMLKPGGCTLVPDFGFRSCCDQHDRDYTEQVLTRLEADKRLRDCIRAAGNPVLAEIYFAGVRVFGGVFWRHKRRFAEQRIEP